MSKYSIGLDFGTNSCRAVIVDISNGKELANHVFNYPSGDAGIITASDDPNLARQNPQDYLQGIEETVIGAIRKARDLGTEFSPDDVIGIGVDTTGSSPLPVDKEGMPLSFSEKFKDVPAAMVWLWKDHTSYAEAQQITETAAKMRPEYLAKIGGVYSSEWFWSKILHCKTENPAVFEAAYSFVEICDWIPAVLTGNMNPDQLKRSVCAAGHKAMYNDKWGGLPDTEFLTALDPGLVGLRNQLDFKACSADEKAGYLSREWSGKLGLSTQTAVAVGAFDAHIGAVGAGVKEGTLVKILGTSTCDIMIHPADEPLADIPGVCGIVDGSVMGGYYGIEAGQSAVGDIFLWFVNQLVPEKYGRTMDEKFKNLEDRASKLKPGETGLLALDWNNGNRTILVDVRLTGLLLGQTLHTQPHEIYRALVEATAFGALAIIDRIEDNGVDVNEVINCGGLAVKNPLLMQIYADVMNRPMKISRSEQTPALGSAIFAAVAAGEEVGGYKDIGEAQEVMTGVDKTYDPISEHHAVYKELYKLYRQLHDGFGTQERLPDSMFNIMKDLLDIRDKVRKEN
ncbi:MAG TPA: ribulokinase [Balneolales bacterium]|nr:ribulokinase [Balneolales bacterium]